MRLTTEEIFRTYTDRLFAIAFTVCQNREDAEDAVQDMFSSRRMAGSCT